MGVGSYPPCGWRGAVHPLSASFNLSLSLHWDATNGARNDRFDGGLL